MSARSARLDRLLLVSSLLLAGCAPGGFFGGAKTASIAETGETSGERPVAAKPAKTKAVDKDAGSYSQQMAKARALENNGRWDDARSIYEKLLSDFPDRYETNHRLGVIADHRRHYAEAVLYYQAALKLHPKDAEIYDDLGYSYFLAGQLSKAEIACSKAVSLEPESPRFHNNLGLIHGNQGNLNAALVDFRKAGSEADAQFNLAFILAEKGNFDGAKDCFRRALDADPTFEAAKKALRSFDHAETDPGSLADYEEPNPDGVRLVPYVEPENGSGGGAKVQRASANAPSPGANTRALQSQARSMMQERMAQQ
ncbi:MAG TPA: tetratricopeptide repeat protein [Pirellulales bacterium]|jgi:Flp pilus assembly protein TadD|nr:tetratricopeptide repeat protein [Pirellulales bacterium]